ncbi:Rha family transcriptional regulator [Proteus mirabilis]|nr:Rha family transcriptional regulator [Proteus mirabilis]MCL8627824.1 Rha family transcriptional regulator [Proteus mirabilis]MCL8635047.1 Rha family transcriptional regulator [Proteus mirabilis]MCR1832591.1 Rha family transcriptional regulator [Proteus mirabilis]MDC6122320.1 Rha family transcriptional regulator [Proteus mirabilis]MDC6136040.1 Rha family transcriptional regulator [Proteus mirabilis]
MSCQEYAGKNRKANSSHLLANPKQNQEGNVSMNELTLASHETNVTMSSREIAELTGKAHHHVVRDIEKMFMELDFNYPKTDDYVSKEFFIKRKNYKGRSVIDEIGLDQDLTMTLMTGYSVPLRHKVSKRWRELESGKATPIVALNDPEFLRSALLNYTEKVLALESSNKELTNKVECMSNLFKEGMTPTQFCKMLNGVNTQQVQMWLAERNWLYNESKSGKNIRWRVASYARDKYMTENQSEINPHGHEPFIKYQPVLLKKGAKRLYDLYLAGELPMKKNWDGLFTHDKEFKEVA